MERTENERAVATPSGALGSDVTGEAASGSGPDSSNHPLAEDQVLALLKRPDLSLTLLEQWARNPEIIKPRKVRFALAVHARTPRRIAIRLVRDLYTFDLMRLALLPAAGGDVRAMADRTLIRRLDSLTLGERISLARRASLAVAAALLADKEPRVWQVALQNSRLTEVAVVKAMQKAGRESALVAAIRNHPKWSHGHEIRRALEQWA